MQWTVPKFFSGSSRENTPFHHGIPRWQHTTGQNSTVFILLPIPIEPTSPLVSICFIGGWNGDHADPSILGWMDLYDPHDWPPSKSHGLLL